MRIGVDLGGTKIAAVLLGDQGQVLQERREPTPTTLHEIVSAIVGIVRSLEESAAVSVSVGIGTPGSVSPRTGQLRNSNTTCLNGTDFTGLLQEALGRHVRIANDANCFALSEAVDGAGAGARTVLGVILGTGTGAGIVMDRRVHAGRHGIAGEWGHNPLPWPTDAEREGPVCYCGKRGCIETWISGPGLARDHFALTGERFTAAAIAERAEVGDPDAQASLDRHADRVARSLATVVNVLDPDVVVLGGGLSLLPALPSQVAGQLGKWVFSDFVDLPVRRALHGDASGVRGAAWLW